MSEAEPQKWYQKTFGIILLLIFFFPYRTLSDVAIWEVE